MKINIKDCYPPSFQLVLLKKTKVNTYTFSVFISILLIVNVSHSEDLLRFDTWHVQNEYLGLRALDHTWSEDKVLITYYFQNGNSTEQNAVRESFKLWEKATHFTFSEVRFPTNNPNPTSTIADITIMWGDRFHYPKYDQIEKRFILGLSTGVIFEGPTVLAANFPSTINKVNSDQVIYIFNDNNYDIYDHIVPNNTNNLLFLKPTVLHEIGHALGLAHSCEEEEEDNNSCTEDQIDSVMFWRGTNGEIPHITENDIRDVNNIYGKNSSSVDIDGDSTPTFTDNCQCLHPWCVSPSEFTYNPTQADIDGDGVGDVCSGNLPPRTGSVDYKHGVQEVYTFINEVVNFRLQALDPAGGSLIFNLHIPATHGDVLVNESGITSYRPSFGFEGDDSFSFRVENSQGLSANGSIIFRVVNRQHSLVVGSTGSGSGNVVSEPEGIDCGSNCVSFFAEGGRVTLKAQPTAGSIFRGWAGSCGSSGSSTTCTIEVDSLENIIARFDTAPSNFALLVNKIGDGSGTVTSDPPGIDCSPDCQENYPSGLNTEVTLIPAPDAGSVFSGWNGACSGTGECKVVMYDDKPITATFSTATPATFRVSNLNDSGAGTLREAIALANNNPGADLIQFTQDLTGTITLTNGQLEILDSLILEGAGADVISISGNNLSRVLRIDPGSLGTIDIRGLTITGGLDSAGNGGGGILVDSGTITIEDSSISNNSSTSGSGGGGIRKFGPGVVTVINSTISGNIAVDAGGGGLRNDKEKLTIINSTISGNSAPSGGGVFSSAEVGQEGLLDIFNSTITNNFGEFGGGGIHNSHNDLILSNSIVSGNSADFNEPEIFHDGGEFFPRGSNVVGENGVSGISTGNELTSSDFVLTGSISTLIAPLADNGGATLTHLPVAGSIAVDNGDSMVVATGFINDQRSGGFIRKAGVVDIGAVELNARISGKITNINNVALQGILAIASSWNAEVGSWQTSAKGITDEQGDFVINGLPGGTYRVCFLDTGINQYMPECFGNAANEDSSVDINLLPAGVKNGINEDLIPGSRLSGLVTDIKGVPTSLVFVTISAWDEDTTHWVLVNGVYTDDSGNYLFQLLKEGIYQICFSDRGQGIFKNQCFGNEPGVPGDLLTVGTGVTMEGINAQMSPADIGSRRFPWSQFLPAIMNGKGRNK